MQVLQHVCHVAAVVPQLVDMRAVDPAEGLLDAMLVFAHFSAGGENLFGVVRCG